ncbi:MAG: hypothetical protein HY075_08995 [Deltaproteobacteria bacterium]|nr:hypothetical protein [Deltaproteobacteria bacterium]
MKKICVLLLAAFVTQCLGFTAPAFAESRRDQYVRENCSQLGANPAQLAACRETVGKKWDEDEKFYRIHHAIRVTILGLLILILAADNDPRFRQPAGVEQDLGGAKRLPDGDSAVSTLEAPVRKPVSTKEAAG